MRTYPTDFKVVEGELTFGSVEACPGCGEELVKRNIARLNYLGVDPNVGMAGAVKALLAVNA